MAAYGSVDVDMDFAYDQDIDPEIALLHAQAEALNVPQNAQSTDSEAMTGLEETKEEGEVDQDARVPKVFVDGVGSFYPDDAKAYAAEHYPSELFKGVQWIDDNTLNLVYDTESAALEALQAFSTVEVDDPSVLRAAKRLSSKPDVELRVRQSTVRDVKVKDAHIYSRFYLDNPTYDPETRKRRHTERSYRGRNYDYKRQRRDYGDQIYHSRHSRDEIFDEDLYDDDPASVAPRARRRNSRASDSSAYGRKKRQYSDEDVMSSREQGRLRNRSASPLRDGDGRYGFEENQPRRRPARPRSRTPLSRRDPAGRDYSHSSGVVDIYRKDLYKVAGPRELFPNHRRQDAHDLDLEYKGMEIQRRQESGEQPRELFSRHSNDQPRDLFSCVSSDKPRDLFSRITNGPSAHGRLNEPQKTSQGDWLDLSTNGAGSGNNNGEFSFLGASTRAPHPRVKELFPHKAGAEKKELFDGRIKGRGQRRRAEDLL
ncbi:hypothetical protein M433DRAFT_149031 [Acidomyces richmondensis BFW]|nr:MAG: hypothetical protein FE78DRAFT_86668 [Acidomyces sp. 'richmondensis']KYG50275.1 hypothetical protein M433DRAFT_149031 [Acidomyces richmondensis BFW]